MKQLVLAKHEILKTEYQELVKRNAELQSLVDGNLEEIEELQMQLQLQSTEHEHHNEWDGWDEDYEGEEEEEE